MLYAVVDSIKYILVCQLFFFFLLYKCVPLGSCQTEATLPRGGLAACCYECVWGMIDKTFNSGNKNIQKKKKESSIFILKQIALWSSFKLGSLRGDVYRR